MTRREVPGLILELKDACRRPLFTNVVLTQQRHPHLYGAPTKTPNKMPLVHREDSHDVETASQATSLNLGESNKRKQPRANEATTQAPPRRTWQELLQAASSLLPCMTTDEHCQVSRLAAILLLGYFVPTSTGNEFYLTQQRPNQPSFNRNQMKEYIWNMDLEERLESATPHYDASSTLMMDPDLDICWHSFLHDGLAPFVSQRPAWLEVDLWHLLAMAIHPQPTHPNHTTRTSSLLHHWSAHCFQINYTHRIQLVKLVAQYLVLQPPDWSYAGSNVKEALFHLRASLHSFAMGALSGYDAHWAYWAITNCSIQSGIPEVLQEEWDLQVNKLVEDRNEYGCTPPCRRITLPFDGRQEPLHHFCPHAARGQLLAYFILHRHQSRRSADSVGLQKMLASLTDAIEWQVDCWSSESDMVEQKVIDPTCLLSAMLYAAQQLFYFLLARQDEEDSSRRDIVIQSAIELLHHWDVGIVTEASKLLVLALSYESITTIEKTHVQPLYKSITIAVQQSTSGDGKAIALAMESIVGLAARRSVAFATSLLGFLMSESKENVATPRLIASVALANPFVAAKQSDRLIAFLEKEASNDKLHFIVALLACRQARFFSEKDDKVASVVRPALETGVGRWDSYRVARQSLVTGNFELAGRLYEQLLASSLKESTFVWMSTLAKIASAESTLTSKAMLGVPSAANSLRSAQSYLRRMDTLLGTKPSSFAFQIQFLDLRLDLLDLLVGIRNLTKEMRLTGVGPGKNTRSLLHLQNATRCLDALAARYHRLYRRYGLFLTQQSRTCLRILYALCHFLTRAMRRVFSDSLGDNNNNNKTEENAARGPKGDSLHPLVLLLGRLDELVLKPIETVQDNFVKAAAMLEVLDGVLMVPHPFPRDFAGTVPQATATLRLWLDPDEQDEHAYAHAHEEVGEADVVDMYPGLSFSFLATGKLSEACFTKSKLLFSTVLLWYRIEYNGPLPDDLVEDKQSAESLSFGDTDKKIETQEFPPVSSRVSSTGNFFIHVECPPIMEEGLYTLKASLGCRDVRGGEWELKLSRRDSVSLRVSRSR